MFFSFGILLFFTSCGGGEGQDEGPPPIERINPKRPDPVKQRGCQERGRRDCEGYEDCEEICDDIFRNRRDKEECYEYSEEMVFDFEDLIEATEKGEVEEIEDIGSYVLECMLDIDEREFAKAVSKMSRREAQDFALLIAENEDFAEVLEEEDDEFNVLKQLINSLTGRSELEEALSQEVEDDKTLLWLFAEVSESAWNWLDDYVSEECGGRDTEDCPGGENIGAYCNALWESGFRTSDWEDFLSDTDLFAEEYESDVEDENYEYEIADEHRSGYDGDFRDYCALKASAAQSQPQPEPQPEPGPCSTGSPEDNQILANVRLSTSQSHSFKYYIHSNYISSANTRPGVHGRATPSQNILLYMETLEDNNHDSFLIITLNGGAISFNQSRTYYIYINNDRYELSLEASHTALNGIEHRRFRAESYPANGRLPASFDVAVASHNGNQCEFYTRSGNGNNEGNGNNGGNGGQTPPPPEPQPV